MSNPAENPLLNAPNVTGGDCVGPIPCCCNAPLQHFLLYVSLLRHKHPLLLFFGDDLPLVGPIYNPLVLLNLSKYAGVGMCFLFLDYFITLTIIY
jgi:hypothetical protein